MSAIWYHDRQQKRIAQKSRAKWQQKLDAEGGGKITTVLEKAKNFTNAEDYHQKYYLRMHPLLVSALGCDTDEAALVKSFAAARLNGFLAGKGSRQQLLAEIDDFDLSAEAREYAINNTKAGQGRGCGV